MITESDITECLIEVDEEKLAELLRDEECFHTSLAKAIVSFSAFNGPYISVTAIMLSCVARVEEHQYKLAEKLAQDKDDARRFQATMKDKFE